ncbi:alpha-ketoglutarate-dependent dioxygenase alkB homolog 4 isoform 1-T1 [Pelodytes ibericus]
MARVEDTLPGSCGCKGIRSCLLCESLKGTCGANLPAVTNQKNIFIYSAKDGGVALGVENTETAGWWFPFPGVSLIQDFVTEDEEKEMVHLMDQEEWRLSQSGRRKQDFGPKVNFKKQKLKVGNFTGLPNFSQVIWQRMEQHAILEGFLPVEQCNLDYNSDRGSAIDSHFDDSWLWGERLVSLNLLSNTVLTMTMDSVSSITLMPILDHETKLNDITNSKAHFNGVNSTPCAFQDNQADGKSPNLELSTDDVEVAISLPRRSLVVLFSDARHKWKHAIHREHIEHRRVCSTFRELSAEFSAGGKEEKLGQMLLQIALGFQGRVV